MITVDSTVIKLTVEGGSLSDWNGANGIVAATEHNGKWLLVNSKGLIFSIDLEQLSPQPKEIKEEPIVVVEAKPMEPKEPARTVPKLPSQRKRYATTKPGSNSSQK
jgi:hypothetical protein